jgi:uncharacterized protein HemX
MTEPNSKVKSNNSSARAFGGVVALVAVIAGVYAMVKPMHHQINYLQVEVAGLRSALAERRERSRDKDQELGENIARQAEKFTEVETQFRSLHSRVDAWEQWEVWWQKTFLPSDARQNEKIAQLERVLHGSEVKSGGRD